MTIDARDEREWELRDDELTRMNPSARLTAGLTAGGGPQPDRTDEPA
jgi:hypothetical protein